MPSAIAAPAPACLTPIARFADCAGVTLTGGDDASLTDWESAYLSGIDFTGFKVETNEGIDLRKSVLSGADFEDASLISSGDITFSYSGASDTTFTNAHLHAGNNLIFSYAGLTNSEFDGAFLLETLHAARDALRSLARGVLVRQ